MGRGPWAGPVVAAAVILPESCLVEAADRQWVGFGPRVGDSKRLSGAQRAAACRVILRHAVVGIGIVSSEQIDRLNIFQATLRAMREAVDDLGCDPELVLVDGPQPPPVRVPSWPVVDGDALCYSVACASIVAKVLRDALMTYYHRLFPAYEFHRHKGYGTALHLDALRRHGPSILHRMSFRPVWESLDVRALAEAATETLDDVAGTAVAA